MPKAKRSISVIDSDASNGEDGGDINACNGLVVEVERVNRELVRVLEAASDHDSVIEMPTLRVMNCGGAPNSRKKQSMTDKEACFTYFNVVFTIGGGTKMEDESVGGEQKVYAGGMGEGVTSTLAHTARIDAAGVTLEMEAREIPIRGRAPVKKWFVVSPDVPEFEESTSVSVNFNQHGERFGSQYDEGERRRQQIEEALWVLREILQNAADNEDAMNNGTFRRAPDVFTELDKGAYVAAWYRASDNKWDYVFYTGLISMHSVNAIEAIFRLEHTDDSHYIRCSVMPILTRPREWCNFQLVPEEMKEVNYTVACHLPARLWATIPLSKSTEDQNGCSIYTYPRIGMCKELEVGNDWVFHPNMVEENWLYSVDLFLETSNSSSQFLPHGYAINVQPKVENKWFGRERKADMYQGGYREGLRLGFEWLGSLRGAEALAGHMLNNKGLCTDWVFKPNGDAREFLMNLETAAPNYMMESNSMYKNPFIVAFLQGLEDFIPKGSILVKRSEKNIYRDALVVAEEVYGIFEKYPTNIKLVTQLNKPLKKIDHHDATLYVGNNDPEFYVNDILADVRESLETLVKDWNSLVAAVGIEQLEGSTKEMHEQVNAILHDYDAIVDRGAGFYHDVDGVYDPFLIYFPGFKEERFQITFENHREFIKTVQPSLRSMMTPRDFETQKYTLQYLHNKTSLLEHTKCVEKRKALDDAPSAENKRRKAQVSRSDANSLLHLAKQLLSPAVCRQGPGLASTSHLMSVLSSSLPSPQPGNSLGVDNNSASNTWKTIGGIPCEAITSIGAGRLTQQIQKPYEIHHLSSFIPENMDCVSDEIPVGPNETTFKLSNPIAPGRVEHIAVEGASLKAAFQTRAGALLLIVNAQKAASFMKVYLSGPLLQERQSLYSLGTIAKNTISTIYSIQHTDKEEDYDGPSNLQAYHRMLCVERCTQFVQDFGHLFPNHELVPIGTSIPNQVIGHAVLVAVEKVRHTIPIIVDLGPVVAPKQTMRLPVNDLSADAIGFINFTNKHRSQVNELFPLSQGEDITPAVLRISQQQPNEIIIIE